MPQALLKLSWGFTMSMPLVAPLGPARVDRGGTSEASGTGSWRPGGAAWTQAGGWVESLSFEAPHGRFEASGLFGDSLQ